MRRAVAFLCCLVVSANLLQASEQALIPENAFKTQLEKIAIFEKQEKFEKAQEAYKSILKKYALTASQLRKVRKRQQALNIQAIFSSAKMPGSTVYEVKAGDRLFDLAKKYKTNMELIRKINHLKEDEIVEGTKLKIITGTFKIKVDKSENKLFLFFNNKLIKEYPVTTGANNKTPVGTYRIINKVENPTWYFDDKVIPAGSKKNLLGTRWMGFDIASYGIHGTVEPEEIGQQASLGCVRMLNQDVEELYLLVPLETSVTIED